MVEQPPERATVKRSLYMDASGAEEIEALAETHLRTWSKELTWLVRLGLRAQHLLPVDAPALDEGRARKYFYPSKEDSDALTDLLAAKNVLRTDGSKEWSFSALVRLLAEQGMRIERQVARGVDSALARLDASGVASAPRRLTIMLMLSNDCVDLLGMLDEPPADVVLKWGEWVKVCWREMVQTALDCRGRLDGAFSNEVPR